MTSIFGAEPEVKTIVLLTYPRGKEFKCYKNQAGWFGHIRDYKPHLFFRHGQWYVVNAGVHYYDHLKPLIYKKNDAAYLWACQQNATPKEREGLMYKMRGMRLERIQNECKILSLRR